MSILPYICLKNKTFFPLRSPQGKIPRTNDDMRSESAELEKTRKIHGGRSKQYLSEGKDISRANVILCGKGSLLRGERKIIIRASSFLAFSPPPNKAALPKLSSGDAGGVSSTLFAERRGSKKLMNFAPSSILPPPGLFPYFWPSPQVCSCTVPSSMVRD